MKPVGCTPMESSADQAPALSLRRLMSPHPDNLASINKGEISVSSLREALARMPSEFHAKDVSELPDVRRVQPRRRATVEQVEIASEFSV